MKRIALTIFRADPARGGAERYTADLATALAARGNSVDLLSTQFADPLPGVAFVPLKARAPMRLARYTRFLDALDAHLAGIKYDIIHAMLPVRQCDVYHPHAGLARENLASRAANRLNPIRRKYASVESDLVTRDTGPILLCLSDYVKASVARNYPGIESRLAKLFNAVDLRRFDPAAAAKTRSALRQKFAIAENAVVALMIAQDFQRKGLPQTIDALAALKDQPEARELKLLVVGKESPGPYAQQARRLGVADRIIFAGATDSPADFYAAADFFVLPTRHDPCSLVVLEALAMGLPVISTVFNGACEIMQEGKHGFILAEPDDIASLAGAMKTMLDAPRRQSMREACLELRSSLSFDAHVDRLESIYRERHAAV